ncbi:MAG: lipoyltransferase [Muribaculaceae bacterium]|nr:lipoyltransferase [Muribaculaceae bacterium]MDE6294987.1 lipoyltransferase [Muribaculaceae bacterium]
MRHIRFDSDTDLSGRRLPFFLALEEWVARRLPAGDYFFSWQVDPTVICGRNQEIDKEVNLEYCRNNGIDVVRRRSGGGSVFADRSNFMFSYITSGDDVQGEFRRYTSMIASALRDLGISAEATGRNDITIGDKKVSGNAFYHLPGRCIAHGTMLYDFDPAHLAHALTPSKGKLESKGVKSVPMRVTCLRREGIGLSPEDFERYIVDKITTGEPYLLSASDIAEVEEIESGYYDPAFMRIHDGRRRTGMCGNARRVVSQARVPGLGEFCVEYDINPSDESVRNVSLTGDFFMSGDVESMICQALEGVRATEESLASAVSQLPLADVLPGMSAATFTALLTDNLKNEKDE